MFVRMYTGEDGKAHFEDIDFPEFKWQTEGAWKGKAGTTNFLPAKDVFFETFPPGYDPRTLRVSFRHKYVITLKGQVEVGTTSGEKRVFGPGDVLLTEDYTGEGHYIKTVGDEQRFSIAIDILPDPPGIAST